MVAGQKREGIVRLSTYPIFFRVPGNGDSSLISQAIVTAWAQAIFLFGWISGGSLFRI